MRPSIAPNRRVFVAVDTDDLDHAQRLAESVSGCVGGFKVGLQLFGRHGVEAVRRMRDFGDIFLDLKFHDIPNTVAGAVEAEGEIGIRGEERNVTRGEGRACGQEGAEGFAYGLVEGPPSWAFSTFTDDLKHCT